MLPFAVCCWIAYVCVVWCCCVAYFVVALLILLWRLFVCVTVAAVDVLLLFSLFLECVCL